MMLPDNLPALLFAVLVIFAAGGVVFYAIEHEPLRYRRWERLAYCYPLGLAALGMPMFVMSWAGIHLHVLPVVLLVGSAAAVAYAIRRAPLTQYVAAQKSAEPGTPLSEMEWFLVAIILACLAARTWASLITPMNDWDGICVWGLKAKVVFFETVRTTGYFNRNELQYSHPIYPLLWPFMYAWVATVLGHWDDVGIFVLNPVNVIVATALLYCALRRQTSRMTSLAMTAAFASFPALMNYTECAQGDVPLMLLNAASLFCLFDWMQSRRLPSLLLAGFLIGGGMFTKEEGKIIFVAHAAVACLSILIAAAPGERTKLFGHLGLYLLIAGIWILPWLVFQRSIPAEEDQFRAVTPSNIRWSELPTLIHAIVRQNALVFYNSYGYPKWNIFWLMAVPYILCSRATRTYPYNLLLGIFLLHASAVLLIWLASTDPIALDVNEFGWERYLLIMMPPIWLLLGKCVDQWWGIWKSPRVIASTPAREKVAAHVAND
jgi:hypothetical protein